jgi:hypothetical protein
LSDCVLAKEDALHKVNERIMHCKSCPLLAIYIRDVGKLKQNSTWIKIIGQSLFQVFVILKLNYWLLDWLLLPMGQIELGEYSQGIAPVIDL